MFGVNVEVQSFPFIVNESVQEKAFTITGIHYKRTPYEKHFKKFNFFSNEILSRFFLIEAIFIIKYL